MHRRPKSPKEWPPSLRRLHLLLTLSIAVSCGCTSGPLQIDAPPNAGGVEGMSGTDAPQSAHTTPHVLAPQLSRAQALELVDNFFSAARRDGGISTQSLRSAPQRVASRSNGPINWPSDAWAIIEYYPESVYVLKRSQETVIVVLTSDPRGLDPEIRLGLIVGRSAHHHEAEIQSVIQLP